MGKERIVNKFYHDDEIRSFIWEYLFPQKYLNFIDLMFFWVVKMPKSMSFCLGALPPMDPHRAFAPGPH